MTSLSVNIPVSNETMQPDVFALLLSHFVSAFLERFRLQA